MKSSQASNPQAPTAYAISSVNLRSLKRFAVEYLPAGSPLREVLVTEEDEISAIDFLAKARVWLTLLRITQGDH
jgi:hypothetical protein